MMKTPQLQEKRTSTDLTSKLKLQEKTILIHTAIERSEWCIKSNWAKRVMYQRQLIKLRNVLLLQWEGHQRRDFHQHRGVQLQEGERWLWLEGGYLQEDYWAGLLQHPWKGNFCLHFLENIFTFSFPPRTRSKSRCARLIFTADKFPDIHPFPVEQPREINDQCEKKSIQPRCDTEVRLVCKYEPVKSCREAKQYCHKVENFGPSGVRALPLAAGINVGGHYKWHFFLLFLSLSPGSLLILP